MKGEEVSGDEGEGGSSNGGGGGGGFDGCEEVEIGEEKDEDLAYCLTELEPCMHHIDDPVIKVAAGYAHSTFLTHSGILYTTGCGVSGQLARFEVMGDDAGAAGAAGDAGDGGDAGMLGRKLEYT